MNHIYTFLLGVITCGFLIALPYYGIKLGSRELPYHRIYGIVSAVDPTECVGSDGNSLPPGPTPVAIRAEGGDCIRQEWTVERKRACDVVPSDPVVRRWIIDENHRVIFLPVIPSEQVGGHVPRMSKTFIQPRVSPGWVSYRAKVCVACPLDAFLLRKVTNPVQLLYPLCIDHLSTEYRVE